MCCFQNFYPNLFSTWALKADIYGILWDEITYPFTRCPSLVQKSSRNISMGLCKKDAISLLTHWGCVFLALTHRYIAIATCCYWCLNSHFVCFVLLLYWRGYVDEIQRVENTHACQQNAEHNMSPLWQLLVQLSRCPKYKSSHLNEFEDRTHVDNIYGCLIFKSVAVTW